MSREYSKEEWRDLLENRSYDDPPSGDSSDTPRTDFVAHESGDPEWNRFPNRFARMMAHACILERELTKAKEDRDNAWNAFTRLRKAYSMIRYPTLTEEIKLLYDAADAVAAGKEKDGTP